MGWYKLYYEGELKTMINYFLSDKSGAVIPISEEGRDRSFVQGTPAYTMIRKILKSELSEEEKQNELRFFTQYGHKKILGSITIESTPSDCFNVTIHEKVFNTYPTHYMRILQAIDEGNEGSLKTVLEEISKDIVNIKLISDYFPKATVDEKEISVGGKFGLWKVERETLRCSLNGHFVCVVSRGRYEKNKEFSEKEEILLAKLLAVSNDQLYYDQDSIIHRQVDSILGFSNQRK